MPRLGKAWLLIICLFFPTRFFAQVVDITGKVLNEEGKLYPGVNVSLDNGKRGTTTDKDGFFMFEEIKAGQHQLAFSAIGSANKVVHFNTDTIEGPIGVKLKVAIQEIDQLVIQGDRAKQLKRTESISIALIKEEFLKESQAGSLVRALGDVPGLNSMDMGTGISKPMIRGLGYYRVVVAQNGIKLEGQQWSNHHGISIDQHSVSHVEVIKGPASLKYGSDAIGGVINILPAHVPLTGGVAGEVSIVGKSNTSWIGASANVSYRKGDIYTMLSLTRNSSGDIHIPTTDSFLLPAPVSSPEASHKVILGNRLHNTAGSENGVSVISGIVKDWGNSYLQFDYHGTKSGFFDWQEMQNDSLRGMHQNSVRDFRQPWQSVDNFSIYHFTNRFFGQDKLQMALGYQLNDTKEYSYLSDITANRQDERQHYLAMGGLELALKLQTYTFNTSYAINSLDNQKIIIGIASQYQNHHQDGFGHILPGFSHFSVGTFVTHQYQLAEKWIINSGARFDYHSIDLEKSLNPDPSYGDSIFNPAFTETYPGKAFSLGLNYLPGNNTIIKLNIGKSYRVPSAYELGAYGLHRHEGRFEKGSIVNQPEEAWQFDLGIDQDWGNLNVAVSPFVNYFTNYLFLAPTPELRSEGQVYKYEQTRTLLVGGESTFGYNLLDRVGFKLGAEYVYAVNLDLKSALPFTPPFSARTEMNYHFRNGKKIRDSKIGVELVSVASQEYTVPNELNTPGYHVVNLKAGSSIQVGKNELEIMAKVRNLFNNRYYNHISFYRRLRIPEPGRDVQLALNYVFKYL